MSDYAKYPKRDVETIANRLETLAKTLRLRAQRFDDRTASPPSQILSGIVCEYLNGIGRIGTYFENLVNNVEHLRRDREQS